MTKISGEYVSSTEVTKIVKRALAGRFGQKNVSVKKGSGTASGWVHADIEIPKPTDCHCEPDKTYCGRCREQLNATADEARKIVYAAMEAAGAEFSTYYSDDGTSDEHDCFLLQVNLARS